MTAHAPRARVAALRCGAALAVVVTIAVLTFAHWQQLIAANGPALRARQGQDEESVALAAFAPARACIAADAVVGFVDAELLRGGALPTSPAAVAAQGSRFILAQYALAPRRVVYGVGAAWVIVDHGAAAAVALPPPPPQLGLVQRQDLGHGFVLYERRR